ncbi:hypothetical protein FNV43_RR17451 [Rhamnella rubrinervis]|uniref:Mannitol dehydrogenase n=1 Tax=Rhamnella rubrinervis TaxID=2594499 RepID=A0A8K0DYU1_9ROSA|nr:hypothetical protein FNV43_RR17451 [Rhamnella rubrinervis]
MSQASTSAGEQSMDAYGWAARDSSEFSLPFISQEGPTVTKISPSKFSNCGICHTDLHLVKDDAGMTNYPVVPGRSRKGGTKCHKVQSRRQGCVGCMVGSCRSCKNCQQDLENYCRKMVWTYNQQYFDGSRTFGGHSDKIVVDEHFAARFPLNFALDGAAPLLCAGITVYSPMKYFGLAEAGMHLGVVGLGGLGHVAVKFAKAMGSKVTVISTSPSKKNEAVEKLGAGEFLVSHDQEQLEAAMETMDSIVDTVSAPHPIIPLIGLLKTNGKLIVVGPQIFNPPELPYVPLIMGRKLIAGSAIGGMKETKEMIDFAAKHNITADVEVIPMDYVNTALERLARGDVRYRFIIDVANTLNPPV